MVLHNGVIIYLLVYVMVFGCFWYVYIYIYISSFVCVPYGFSHGFMKLYANLRYSEIIRMIHGHCMSTFINTKFERTYALVDGLHAQWPRFCCSAAGELLQLHNQHLPPAITWLIKFMDVPQHLDSQSLPGMPHGKCLAPGRACAEKLLANLGCKSSK